MPDLWCIYHVDNCRYVKPNPKAKYVAIVCQDQNGYWGFFVNSKIHSFFLNKPKLLDSQVKILACEHRKLSHDSYINCSDLKYYFESELSNCLCPISENAKTKIKEVVSISITIEKNFKLLISG